MDFWSGFEKRAEEYTLEQNLEKLKQDGRHLNQASNIMLGLGAAGVGAGLLRKSWGLGGVGTVVGLVGASGKRYPRQLAFLHKHLSGQPGSDKEWEQFVMENPSGSLLYHVHPKYREQLAHKFIEAHNRMFGDTQ